jgi:SanA protein
MWMISRTDARVCNNVDVLPPREVGLVLGTSPRLSNGKLNWHFKVRVDAAAKLYTAGKVHHLLLSGDNHIQGYDEPTEMKETLLKLGVPESVMTLDYAGFRTLDSVARAHAIFGLQTVTIVTEDFHAHRSIFLAEHSGVNAVVFCADSLGAKWSARSKIREAGARVKAALDIYVLHTKPKFLGDKIEIKVQKAA